MNIQVFTKDLADDFLIRSQVDFEAYNAALVYGGNDTFSDNPIQQPYQELLVRGFRQNWVSATAFANTIRSIFKISPASNSSKARQLRCTASPIPAA